MREVAVLETGNFRGVCPILNRAKQKFVRNTVLPRNGKNCAYMLFLPPGFQAAKGGEGIQVF